MRDALDRAAVSVELAGAVVAEARGGAVAPREADREPPAVLAAALLGGSAPDLARQLVDVLAHRTGHLVRNEEVRAVIDHLRAIASELAALAPRENP